MINLMTYDIHGHWEDKTGHHALAHTKLSDDRLGGIFYSNIKIVLKNKKVPTRSNGLSKIGSCSKQIPKN